MRVVITINPRDPHRDLVRDDAERWSATRPATGGACAKTRTSTAARASTFEFIDPLDGMDFHYRVAPAEHRGRLV